MQKKKKKLHQSLTFESFLANGVSREASFLLLRPTDPGHSMCFEGPAPCGMLQPKRSQSAVQGRGVRGGCVGMLTRVGIKSEKGDCSVERTWGAKELELSCCLWELEPAV